MLENCFFLITIGYAILFLIIHKDTNSAQIGLYHLSVKLELIQYIYFYFSPFPCYIPKRVNNFMENGHLGLSRMRVIMYSVLI